MAGDFESLEIYQLSQKLIIEVYELLKLLPNDEKYALAIQLKRAALSVGANIAEGAGRYHFGDKIKFMYQARGSLFESKHFLRCAQKLHLAPEQKLAGLISDVDLLSRKLNSFIGSLCRKRENN